MFVAKYAVDGRAVHSCTVRYLLVGMDWAVVRWRVIGDDSGEE